MIQLREKFSSSEPYVVKMVNIEIKCDVTGLGMCCGRMM